MTSNVTYPGCGLIPDSYDPRGHALFTGPVLARPRTGSQTQQHAGRGRPLTLTVYTGCGESGSSRSVLGIDESSQAGRTPEATTAPVLPVPVGVVGRARDDEPACMPGGQAHQGICCAQPGLRGSQGSD